MISRIGVAKWTQAARPARLACYFLWAESKFWTLFL